MKRLIFALLALSTFGSAATITSSTVLDRKEMPSLGFPLDDTLHYSAWSATGGNFNGGRIFGSCNDCDPRQIQLLELTGVTTHGVGLDNAMRKANAMLDYPHIGDSGCWNIPNFPLTYGCKTYDPVFFHDVLYWSVVDFLQASPYQSFRSTIIMSPDFGVHFCNANTYNVGVGGTPYLCNSSNWRTGGDMDADASTLMWPTTGPSTDNQMGRLALIQVCQDNSINCPTIAGMDNANYIYFTSIGQITTSYLHRVLKSCAMSGEAVPHPLLHQSCWTHWDGTVWNTDYLQSANISIPGQGMMYSKYSHMFYTFGGDQTSLAYAYSSSIFGPWTGGTFDCSGISGGCSGGFPTPILATLYYDTNLKADVFTVAADNTYTLQQGWFHSVAFGYDDTPFEDPAPPATSTSVLFPLPWGIGGAASNLTSSILISNTQAVISYVAPSSSACTVEVSESNTYSPIIPDVDNSLFTGEQLDSRTGSFSNGTARIFAIGKRLTYLANDAKKYPRALKANTTYYWRACGGGAGLTGSFTTKNVPTGATHNEMPQIDPATPGGWMLPTFPESRTAAPVVDPKTGVLLKQLTLLSDQGGSSTPGQCPGSTSNSCGVVTGYGGFTPNCANAKQTAGNGKQGFLCAFQFLDQGSAVQFFIVPSTHEVLRIGSNGIANSFDGLDKDRNIYATDSGTGFVYRYHYSGDLTTESTTMPMDAPVLYSSVTGAQLMHAFDPTFDASVWGCDAPIAAAGEYTLIHCGRNGIQNAYGWNGFFYGGDGRTIDLACSAGAACPRIVAAQEVAAAPVTRHCTIHQLTRLPQYNVLEINYHGPLFGDSSYYTGNFGGSPHKALLVGSMSANANTITIDNALRADDPLDSYRVPIAVGDLIALGNPRRDSFTVTSITAGTGTQIILGITGHADPTATSSSGDIVWGACMTGQLGYWKFLNDIHGTDTTNTNMVIDQYFDGGGHAAYGKDRITEGSTGYEVVFGPPDTQLNIPISLQVTDSPTFAGVFGRGWGDIGAKHPSVSQDVNQVTTDQASTFFDKMGWGGSQDWSGGPFNYHTLISGQLYKAHPGVLEPIDQKRLEIVARSARRSLRDISGPATGNVIADDSSTPFTFCRAMKANECRTGSVAGDIYANVPSLDHLWCDQSDGPGYGPPNDLCFAPMNAYMNGALEIHEAASADLVTRQSRILSYGLAGLGVEFHYPTFKPLPDMSWGLLNVGVEGDASMNVWMAQIPPLPADDGIDRSTWIPGTVNITTPTGLSIATAEVEFGYLEYGTAAQHYCTSRQEACVAESIATQFGGANPFYYSSEAHSKTLCSVGCKIKVPEQPLKMAYYQVKFYNAAGTFVQNGTSGMMYDGREIH